ncbi:MAG TPA: tetratricopeptide repeat protein [Candidatus Dormibacteraeota bacterium]|nr:tetratricopeptide repeat protein [Candidatus Dormibacteraeota bacterium]
MRIRKHQEARPLRRTIKEPSPYDSVLHDSVFAFSLRLLIFLPVILLPLLSLAAAFDASSFDAANKLYYEGKYTDAAAQYEKLIESGARSAALYFNSGNAFFKSGQIGRAIAAYKQAETLAPRDPDIRANLQFARNQVQGPSFPRGNWQRVLGKLSINEWTVLAAAAFWVFLLLLALLQWRPALRSALRGAVVASIILTVSFSSALGAVLYEKHSTRRAVVVAPEATARIGPLEASGSKFVLHDGAEIEVLNQRDDWLEIATGPQRIGWLRRNQVAPE